MSCIKKRKVPPGFGNRLNMAIAKSGLGLCEIERRFGVNHSNIVEYCNETMLPSAYNLWALCKCLNVSADWLLGLKSEQNE